MSGHLPLAAEDKQADNPAMAIKVAAFDVYQTLATWPDDRVRPIEVQRLLGRFGIEISYQAFEAARQGVMFFDTPKRTIEGWMDFLALVYARMGVAVPMDIIAETAKLHESSCRMQIYPDALPAIQAAKQAGLTTCAFTTLPRFMLACGGGPVLAALDAYFDAAATGLTKGHPRFYTRITELLNVCPEEILCVGDDPICDVELPQEAGWHAVLLNRTAIGPVGSSREIRSLGVLIEQLDQLGH